MTIKDWFSSNRIEELEARNALLEKRLFALEAIVDEMERQIMIAIKETRERLRQL